MTAINGTNLAASIVPFTTDDQFATHQAKYGQGGWQEVATIQDRDAITSARREAGMAVYVTATSKVYILAADLTTWNELESGKVDDVTVNGTSVVENKVAKVVVPTKTSDITNDSGFITKDVNDLTNYTKTSDLATVATSGSYNDLSNQPTIGDGTLTIQKNGTTVATFTANATGNVTANIEADQQVQADWSEGDSTKPDYIKNKPTKVSDFTNDAGYITKSVNNLENYTKTSDLPSVIDNTTSSSTTDALSANQGRVLQSEIESLQGLGRYLSTWNCATGLAGTNPPTSPYTYHSGDYFLVGVVSSASPAVNYKPTGASYTTGVASTVVETEDVKVNDVYIYDGSTWKLQQNAQREVTFSSIAGQPTDNANLATALGGKQDTILDLDTIRSGAGLGSTSLQPNDNISELNNDAGYTTNVGTVTSVNNVQPDANGNVTITIPSSDVTDVQIYGVSKVTSGVANLNVVEQVTSLPLSDVWMGRTVQYVGPDYPSNDIYRGYYYIYETRPYGEHLSRTGWWQLDVQPGGAAVNDGTLTIQKNGTQVGTFTANQSTNSTINITVPTNTSDLTNNSGFITSSDIPVTDVTVGGTSVVTSGVAAVPAIPTVNNSTITLTQGGTTKGTFTLNQSSGATIDFDAGQVIQVDASTMPDASTCAGRIVQWVGNTSSMTGFTKGYFYISGAHLVYSATITAEDWSPSYTSIIADFFVHKFEQVMGRNPEFDEDLETIYFLYDGSKWDLVDICFGYTTTITDVTLSEYGVTVTGTPTNGSKLNIVPTVDFVSSWNRINVQPDNGATVVYDAINEELTIS